jgi:hypothetical protein
LIAITSSADCVSDCRSIIEKSNQAIAARDQEIADQGKTITDLTASLNTAKSDLSSADSSLDEWYHNPVILLLMGAVIGGAGVVILQGK